MLELQFQLHPEVSLRHSQLVVAVWNCLMLELLACETSMHTIVWEQFGNQVKWLLPRVPNILTV